MICKYNRPFVERNKRREKKGLPPLSRRQFCKYAAASSAALGLVGLIGCEPDDSSGNGQSWGCGGPAGPGDGGSDYVRRTLGEDNRAEIDVRPGVELDDYSGPFRPDLRYTDFSKVGLGNLIQMANDYHNTIQNRYRQFVYDKHGHAGLVDSEAKIWGRNMVYGIKRMIKETMNINGWNLEAFMKQWQVDFNMIPGAHYDLVFDMPTRRRGIVTINRCTVAEQYEAAGRTNELRDVCMARCGNAIQNAAKKYNSNIIAKNLTMPPRPNDDYVCCKWELYYRMDGSRCSEENDLLIDSDKMDKRGELAARPGVNLDDYCGPFRPDLRMTDFSREQLARMYLMYHQYCLNMIELYQVWEMGQVGFSESADMHVVVWSNDLAEAARSIMMKYLNTSGSGIDNFLKALQVDITAQPPNFDNDFEMPDENTGIYTFNKCFGMTMMEPIACEKQIMETCALDPPAIGNSCDMYSRGLAGRRIKLDIITMPPRTYTDEVCCQWKFSYVEAPGP